MESTEWHNIVLWRGLAEVAEKLLKKGMQVYVEGRLRTRSWEDKDGTKKRATEITADVLNILGGRKAYSETGAQDSIPSSTEDIETPPPTDLPF